MKSASVHVLTNFVKVLLICTWPTRCKPIKGYFTPVENNRIVVLHDFVK